MAVAIGCGVLAAVGSPDPTLFGGLLGALVLAVPGLAPQSLPRVGYLAGQGIVGVGVGAQISWAALRELSDQWPVVLSVVTATLVLSFVAGLPLRRFGASTVTAAFASVPGGASGMSAIADDLGADSRVVAVLQYVRVMVILLTLPVVVSVVFGQHASTATVDGGASARNLVYALLALVIGVTAGLVLRLPSPAVLGGLLAGLLLTLVPAFGHVRVPLWVQAAGFVLIGVQVGLKFTWESLRSIGRMLPVAFVGVVVTIAGCALLGLLLARATGVSRFDAYLATTPGGLPAVLATSTTASGNVTFISAVQVTRLLLVLVLAPLVGRFLRAAATGPDNPSPMR